MPHGPGPATGSTSLGGSLRLKRGLGTPLTLGDEGIRPGRPFKLLIPPAPPTGRLQSPARGPQEVQAELPEAGAACFRPPPTPAPPTAGSPASRAACREARACSAPRRRAAVLPPPPSPVEGSAGAACDAQCDVLTRPSGAASLSPDDLRQGRGPSRMGPQRCVRPRPSVPPRLKAMAVRFRLCPTLCDSMGCSAPGASVHGILQARILKWVAVSFSRAIFATRRWNPGLPGLQADALRSEPPGKSIWIGSLFSLVAQNPPAMRETRVRSLGREDSPGEGNGYPLQYSSLENPMDRGAWRDCSP